MSLHGADLVVVEGGIVVNIAVVHQQAVIGDDLDALLGGLVQGGAQGGALDGGDDNDLAAIVDHGLDLVQLGGNVVGGKLQLNRISGFLQLLFHVGAVLIPTLQVLGGHGNADQFAFGQGRDAAQSQHRAEYQCKNLLHTRVHSFDYIVQASRPCIR